MYRYHLLTKVLLLFFLATPIHPVLAQDRTQSIAVYTGVCNLGASLTAAQAASLELKLAADPTNLNERTEILGYSYMGQFRQPALRALHQATVFWFIRNAPQSVPAGLPEMLLMPRQEGAAYSKAKNLWLVAVKHNAKSTAVLSNAASFFTLSDPQIAERLLKNAEALEPKNPDWPAQLAQLYRVESDRGSLATQQAEAALSLAAFENAGQLLSGSGASDLPRSQDLADATKMAYRAGAYDKAQRYAMQLLQAANGPGDQESADDTYTGNMILGELGLVKGDIREAQSRLQACGNTEGSNVMDSFGPNMSLAQDMLRAGQRAAVLQFLDKCAAFWHEGPIQQWKDQINQGKIPDFGANLDY